MGEPGAARQVNHCMTARSTVVGAALIALLVLGPVAWAAADDVPSSACSRAAVDRVRAGLTSDLEQAGLHLGAPVFLRILKTEAELEAWVRGDDGRYVLFRTWPICTFSGDLGPKQAQGDRQAPEGFYFVPPGRMNPLSSFHLSFDLGYPNAFDRSHGRTGAWLMVHGSCVSIGCYAMTDPVIEQVWTLMQSALAAGQPFVRVHAFPFRMTEENLAVHADSEWAAFWSDLAVGWRAFEDTMVPPNVRVAGGRYVFDRREPP